MKYHKPLPVKQTFITNDGIPTSVRGSKAGQPIVTHGNGNGGSGGGSGSGSVTIDWPAERPNVEVCASNVYNC